MMSFDLLLDSSLAKLQRGGERNVSHDFTIKFHPPIQLGSGNYEAALNRLIAMSTTSTPFTITTKFAGERKLKRGRP